MQSGAAEGGIGSSELSKRKVNLLIVASSLWIGGAEMVIRSLARAIDRSRFNVTVCHLKQRGHIGDELFREGIDIVGISALKPVRFSVDYFSFVKLQRVLRGRKIDLVHTHTTHGLVDACLCKLLMPRLRVIHTFHFGNYPYIGTRIRFMERMFSRIANQLIAVGDTQRQKIRTVYGFSDRQISTIWNGVSTRSGSGDPRFRG